MSLQVILTSVWYLPNGSILWASSGKKNVLSHQLRGWSDILASDSKPLLYYISHPFCFLHMVGGEASVYQYIDFDIEMPIFSSHWEYSWLCWMIFDRVFLHQGRNSASIGFLMLWSLSVDSFFLGVCQTADFTTSNVSATSLILLSLWSTQFLSLNIGSLHLHQHLFGLHIKS